MRNDPTYSVTISRRGYRTKWQVFATNHKDRFIFAVKRFTNRTAANVYAERWANRLSCAIESVQP